jgi:hypothetical protein
MTTTTTTKTTTDLEQFYTQVLKDFVLQERLKAATGLSRRSPYIFVR